MLHFQLRRSLNQVIINGDTDMYLIRFVYVHSF